jgi:hypothetical protein
MAVKSEYLDSGDRQRLVGAADLLIAALESACHSTELWHIRGDLGQLQKDVERVRRTVQDQPPSRPWYVLQVWFWPFIGSAVSVLPDGLVA